MTVIKYQGKTEKEKKKACCQTLSKHDFDLRVSEISRSGEIRSLVPAGVELAFHARSLSKVIMRVRKPTVAHKLVLLYGVIGGIKSYPKVCILPSKQISLVKPLF